VSEPWHPLITYREGERCRFLGKTFEARVDLCRGLKPVGHLSEKFWRQVPTIAVPKSTSRKSASDTAIDQIREVVQR
jgi:hypothetical protein